MSWFTQTNKKLASCNKHYGQGLHVQIKTFIEASCAALCYPQSVCAHTIEINQSSRSIFYVNFLLLINYHMN